MDRQHEEQRARFVEQLEPLVAFIRQLDAAQPEAAQAALAERFPLDGPVLSAVRAALREGVEAGWLAEREAGGIRFGRLRKASGPQELSIDVVHMDRPGPGHTHPRGEFDLCFAVSGQPRFDGQPEGWTVYGPQSWHVPTVEGGTMDILYFLPGGEIRFEPRPDGAAD